MKNARLESRWSLTTILPYRKWSKDGFFAWIIFSLAKSQGKIANPMHALALSILLIFRLPRDRGINISEIGNTLFKRYTSWSMHLRFEE